jgi:FkbM family methyltransferase
MLKSLLMKFVVILLRLLSSVDNRIARKIEIEVNRIQGKGGGEITVEKEARIALDFLGRVDSENLVVFDVGANQGLYTEAILRLAPQARIFAFEPSSSARAIFESKLHGDEKIEVIPFALGESIASAELYSDTPGSGLASLTKRRLDHFGIDFNYAERIQITTLDSFIESTGVVPNILKMDVEGHELSVLKGGLANLEKIQVIQFEFGGCNIDTRTFFQDFWYTLTPLGFSIFRISPSGRTKIESYSEEEEYFNTSNFIAARLAN